MTPQEAINILRPYATKKVASVYTRVRVADALMTLIPNFEYPDWSWQVVQVIITRAENKLQREEQP